MSRLPVRARLAAAFALAMLIALVVVGGFVYAQIRSDLDETLDESLRTRADDIASLASAGGALSGLDGGRLVDAEDSFTQVLARDGSVLASTLSPTAGAAVSRAEARRAAAAPLFVTRGGIPDVDGNARVFARSGSGGTLVVVGASTQDRTETLDRLMRAFLIGAPLAVLLAAGLGYVLAGRWLAPVEAALQRERAFVADASHELRTPLAILRAELDSARRPGRSSDELRAALDSAGEEVDHLARLADDLLAIASAEDGRLPLRRETIAAAVLLGRIRDRFAPRASAAGRMLIVEAPSDLVLDVDPLRMEQALGNLVDNALRHGAGTVRVEATTDGATVSMSVADEGGGLPAEFVPRAFERFARADEGRTRGGAGLGLAIVRAVATAHGGDVTATGATIAMTLPAA